MWGEEPGGEARGRSQGCVGEEPEMCRGGARDVGGGARGRGQGCVGEECVGGGARGRSQGCVGGGGSQGCVGAEPGYRLSLSTYTYIY